MSKIRVMLADNNRELCMTLADLIRLQDDMELTGVAFDGIETLQVIEDTHPEVLILDITMPYLDGIGVLERLSEMPERPVVIVLTVFEQEAMIQRITALGAVYYMVKPFDAPTLFERIRQFASGKMPTYRPVKVQEERPIYFNRTPSHEKTTNELELEVSRLFHEMGIPAHFRGYAYLREAVVVASREVEVLGNITKNLYPRIAEKYRSTTSGVESAIRHTIEIAWERGNTDFMEDFFGFDNQKGRFPTTASFIAKVSDRLRLETTVV